MDKTEPTFVPEWLKNNGTSAATSSHQSLLQSDDQSVPIRRKSLVNVDDNDSKRATSTTTSSYFRRTSSSNGRLRSYGSFGRRDWDKNKEKYENKYRDFDPLGSILPSRFEKDGLRRSQSNLSAKRGESWNKKVVGERNIGNSNNNGKVSFEKDFPSLGSDEKQGDCEIGRVPSPGLSSAIQSLPVGSLGGIGGADGWTSALAEVPVMVGPNGQGSVSATMSVGPTGRNMAEALAQGPPRAQTAPQLSVGSQRLEELAVKQSRQLIPMTQSMSKASAMNSDKPKLKMGPSQLQSSHIMNHSPSTRPVFVNADVTKSSSPSSTVGKLHVLKPSRERNGTTITKESVSPTTGTKLPESPSVDRKPLIEKRPSPQAKSRNDFFNLMRKKAMANNTLSSSAVSVDPPELTDDKTSKGGVHLNEDKVDLGSDGDVCVVNVNSNNNNNVKDDLRSDVLDPEEEEARFLRSMGWEETTEEECLTEEEINSFYRDLSKYVNLKRASSYFKGTQLKSLMPLNLLMGKNGEFSADTTKVDS
ncbi:uncharacterized protein LOC143531223 [Bidens hawaiensis]|uniref:uncharacterized protein LOC143531223 n=1 Tax=Bidens hawaiensis TaxID=980011 RepID=UPI0040498B8C